MMNLSSMLVVQRNAFSGNIKRYFDVLPCPLVQLLAQTQTLRFGICFPTAVADRSPLAVAVAVAVAVAEKVQSTVSLTMWKKCHHLRNAPSI